MKQVIDQSLHFWLGALFFAPAVFWPGLATFAFATWAYGFVREVTEEGRKVTLAAVRKVLFTKGSWPDMVAWALPGAAIWFTAGQPT